MAGIVNLRRAARRRARDAARGEADANAALHGEPVALRRLRAARADLEEGRLEAHRQEGHVQQGHGQEGHGLETHRLDTHRLENRRPGEPERDAGAEE